MLVNNPQSASRFTENHTKSEFNKPNGKEKTPSVKESNYTNRYDQKVSEIYPQRPPEVPGLNLPGRSPNTSKFETGRSQDYPDRSSADYSPSEQQGTTNRKSPIKESPGKLSASESLKARFGQLGLKAMFV